MNSVIAGEINGIFFTLDGCNPLQRLWMEDVRTTVGQMYGRFYLCSHFLHF